MPLLHNRFGYFFGKDNYKCGAFTQFAGSGNKAFVFFHNFFADGKTNARTGKLVVTVQALEHHKNIIGIFGIETNAIVCNSNTVKIFFVLLFAVMLQLKTFYFFGINGNVWRVVVPAKF